MSSSRIRLRSTALAVAALALASTSLAACGGGGDGGDGVASVAADASSDTTEATGEAASSEEELLDFVECLRGEGLDVPDPEVDANGNLSLGGGPGGGGGDGAGAPDIDREAFDAAIEVCGDVPTGAIGGFEDVDQSAFQDAALEFAQCMRDNGVEMDDPDFSGGPPAGGGPGAGGGPFGDVDQDDPAVQAAMEECQDIFADAGVGAPGGQG